MTRLTESRLLIIALMLVLPLQTAVSAVVPLTAAFQTPHRQPSMAAAVQEQVELI